jgi:hypothetical protein
VGLRDTLRLVYNSCAQYFFGIRRSEQILGYSARTLRLPLGRYYSFRICCQMYRMMSTRKPDYLYRGFQFGHSTRLSNLIVCRHHYAFNKVRLSEIVCLRQSGATLVRGSSEVNAVRLSRKLLTLNICDDPLQGRRERFCFLIYKTFRYLCHLVGENCVAYFCQNAAKK